MPLYAGFKRKIRNLYGNKCAKCGSTKAITVDHIIQQVLLEPFGFVNWGHKQNNLQLLCQPCNVRKGCDLDYTNPRTLLLLREMFERVEFFHGKIAPLPRRKYVWRMLDVKSLTPKPTVWHSEKKHQKSLAGIYTKMKGIPNCDGILIT